MRTRVPGWPVQAAGLVLLAGTCLGAPTGNLLINGSFESPVLADSGTASKILYCDFEGWEEPPMPAGGYDPDGVKWYAQRKNANYPARDGHQVLWMERGPWFRQQVTDSVEVDTLYTINVAVRPYVSGTKGNKGEVAIGYYVSGTNFVTVVGTGQWSTLPLQTYSPLSASVDTAVRRDLVGKALYARIFSQEGVNVVDNVVVTSDSERYKAYIPRPADGAGHSGQEIVLAWKPSTLARQAGGHDRIYFSTNQSLVSSRSAMVKTDLDPGVTSFDPSGSLAPGTYYWRVDGVNGANVAEGDVWSFTVDGAFNSGYVIWSEPPTTKVARGGGKPSYPDVEMTMSLARRESESVQLVVKAADGIPLQNVSVTISNLVGASGTFPSSNITWRQVGYIRSGTAENAAWSPDLLLPVANFSVMDSGVQPLWITAYAPPGTAAGTYSGSITIQPSGKPPQSARLQVTVYDFALEKGAGRLENTFSFYRLKANYEENFSGSGEYRAYADTLLRNRINPDNFYANYTFRVSDLEHFLDRGMTHYTVAKSDGNDKLIDKFLTGTFSGSSAAPDECLPPSVYARELRHIANFYGYDEKHEIQVTQSGTRRWWDEMRDHYGDLKNRYPDIRRGTTAYIYLRWNPPANWDPVSDMRDHSIDTIYAGGGDGYYNTAVGDVVRNPYNLGLQYAVYGVKSGINSDLLTCRSDLWKYYKNRADGLLHYTVSQWDPGTQMIDPAQGPFYDTDVIPFESLNGFSGALIFKGTNGTPIETVRLANVRDALEDYDYLWRYAEATGGRAAAEAKAVELLADLTLDNLTTMRNTLAQAIVAGNNLVQNGSFEKAALQADTFWTDGPVEGWQFRGGVAGTNSVRMLYNKPSFPVPEGKQSLYLYDPGNGSAWLAADQETVDIPASTIFTLTAKCYPNSSPMTGKVELGIIQSGTFSALASSSDLSTLPLQVWSPVTVTLNTGTISQHVGKKLVVRLRVDYQRSAFFDTVRLARNWYPARLPEPANLATNVNPHEPLRWAPGDDVQDTEPCTIYYSTNYQDVVSGSAATAWVPRIKAPASDWTPGSTVYWRVDSPKRGGGTYVGDVWSFTVNDGRAYNPSPADQATDVAAGPVLLRWMPAPGAESHKVYFGTNPTGLPLVATKSALDNKCTTGTLQAGRTYYWRIDEIKGGVTTNGAVWSFRTGPKIQLDATSSFDPAGTNLTSGTWAHTVGSGSNRMLVVALSTSDSGSSSLMDSNVSSITYGGVPMTEITGASQGNSTYYRTRLFYLPSPAVGTANVVITLGGTVSNVRATAVSLFNVAQLAPENEGNNFLASGKQITTSMLTITDGAMIVDLAGSSRAGSMWPTYGVNTKTRQLVNIDNAPSMGVGLTYAETNGTQSISWSSWTGSPISHSLAAFAPAP